MKTKRLPAVLLAMALAWGTVGCTQEAPKPTQEATEASVTTEAAELTTQAVTEVTLEETTLAETTEATEAAVTEQTQAEQTYPTEPGAVAVPTKYIILGYPQELEGQITATCQDLEDGQEIIFTTDITGQSLELFRFSISLSGTDGYVLGTLEDGEAGSLTVCVNVPEFTNGSWEPEEFNRLTQLQSRVNDIIIRFHEDSRFVPSV